MPEGAARLGELIQTVVQGSERPPPFFPRRFDRESLFVKPDRVVDPVFLACSVGLLLNLLYGDGRCCLGLGIRRQ